MRAVSFADNHDATLMRDPALMDPAAPGGATMGVTMTDGRTVNQHFLPSGTNESSLITEDMDNKACNLMTPVLAATRLKR